MTGDAFPVRVKTDKGLHEDDKPTDDTVLHSSMGRSFTPIKILRDLVPDTTFRCVFKRVQGNLRESNHT